MPDPYIVVTGGAGFIGSHVCEALVARGATVCVFDNFSSGRREHLASLSESLRVIEGDVRDAVALQAALRGATHVVHLAALVSVPESVERPMESHAINATGTLQVLLAARAHRVRRVVLASTAAVYGRNAELPAREAALPAPESPYAADKLAAEHYMRIFAQLYGVETVSLRFFNVYGPRQPPTSPYSGVISRFVDAVRQGRRPTIYGDGQQTRDFVFVSDVVAAVCAALFHAGVGAGECYNVGTGQPTALLELLDILADLCDTAIEPDFAPPRPGDIRHSVASVDRLAAELGVRAKISVREGLRLLLDAEDKPATTRTPPGRHP